MPDESSTAGAAPFQCFREATGDIWVAPGRVVNSGSSSTDSFTTKGAYIGGIGGVNGSQHFMGGSGRNYLINNGPSDEAFPVGYFRADSPDLWNSPAYTEATLTRDPGTGDLTLNDGTDDVGTGPAASSYSGVASAGTWPVTNWTVISEDATFATFQGVEDVTATLYHDKITGDSFLRYGSLVSVAERLGGSTVTAAGVYTATATGETDWNTGSPWTYTVSGGTGVAILTASAYAESTYNGGNPFTFDVTPETDQVGQAAVVSPFSGSAQAGIYAWTGWQAWTSEDGPTWGVTIDNSGEGSLSDGTDVVATREADASRLYDPSGPYVSTAYGDTNYGGTEDVTSGVSSAGTFGDQDFALAFTVGDIETWNGVTDSSQYVELDTLTGDALLMDGNDTVAERLGGSTTDIDGIYTATSFGEVIYNASTTWDFTVSTATVATGFSVTINHLSKRSLEGTIYCVVARDAGTGEATGITGPFYGTMPANTSTARSIPIATVASDGTFEQIQFGPINWITA